MRPNPGNMANMMRQVKKMQAEMTKAQTELKAKTFDGQSADGLVKVTMNGEHHVVGLTIQPELIDPEDPDMLTDLVLQAVNQATDAVDKATESTLGQYTKGLF